MAQVFQMARIACTYSAMRGAGADHGTLNRRSLCPFTWLPRPSTNRPFEAACRSHAVEADTIGLRGNEMATLVASRTRSLCTAAIPSGMNGSCRFSMVTTQSYPSASIRRTSSGTARKLC